MKIYVKSSRQPKWWNSMFTGRVIDAYNAGELTLSNLKAWEQQYADKYNNGVNPGNFGTKAILQYYMDTGKDPRKDSI